MKARVTVMLKTGVLDPQGEAVRHALGSLGFQGVGGVRQGKVIELERDPGLPDGEAVVVVLRSVPKPGDGIRRSAGAWAGDGEDLDQFLEEVRRSRHAERGAPGR